MYGEAVGERLKDFYQTNLRYQSELALLMKEHPELITLDSDGQIVVETDLAFLDDICLV